jgi:hypothetical protein
VQTGGKNRSRKVIDDEDEEFRLEEESTSDISDEEYDLTKEEEDEDEEMEENSVMPSTPAAQLLHTSAKTIDSAPQPTASKKRASTKSGKKSRSKGKTSRTKELQDIEEDDIMPEEEQEEEDLLAPEETQSPITPSKAGSKKRAGTNAKSKRASGTPQANRRRRKRITNQTQEEDSNLLSEEEETQTTTSTSRQPKTPQSQFWEFVDQHFGFINDRRLELLREQSEDDEAFKIPPLGRLTDEGEEVPVDDSRWVRKFGTVGIAEPTKLDVDWSSRSAFSTHSMTQRLLCSLVEENDIVPLEDILKSTDLTDFEHSMDGTSASAAMEYKKKKKPKLAGSVDVRQGVMAVASYTTPVSILGAPKKPPSELEKLHAEESNRLQANFSKYQQNKFATNIKKSTLSLLGALREDPGILQNSTVSTSDYDESAMDLFEERLASELKNIGVLEEDLDAKTVIGLPSYREDDEVSAELRTLQAQLRERMKPTNESKRKVLEQVLIEIDDERRREKKDEEMRAIEREWYRFQEAKAMQQQQQKK